MKDDKEFEEIEIEQIDLDIDQEYDISIDVSSIGNLEYENKEETIDLESFTDLSFKEESTDVSLNTSVGTPLESDIESFESKEEVPLKEEEISDVDMVSISNEELDAILGGASVKEEEAEGVNIEELVSSSETISEESSEVTLGESILEEALEVPSVESEGAVVTSELEAESIFSELESKDISISEEELESVLPSVEETISSEEVVSSGIGEGVLSFEETSTFEEEKKPEIVVMSTDEYNKMVEESKSIPIVEKPLEEVFEVGEEAEEIEVKEEISPEEVGVSSEFQDFELKEFEEISEDMVVAKALGEGEAIEGMEVIESGVESMELLSEEEAISIGAESDIVENIPLVEESVEVGQEEKFGLVDDISIDVDISPQSQVSVMPDEVGLEEISVEPVEVSSKEEITGISFMDTTSEVVEEEPSLSMFEEVVVSEIPTGEEKTYKVEEIVVSEVPTKEEKTYEVGETVVSEVPTKEERAYKVEKAIDELSEEERDEVRKVLLYLDKLLESLPEDKIKEFAQSEYYDIYVKLFDKLNLK